MNRSNSLKNKKSLAKNNNIHTFVVLAYKESIYLEECIKSVLNQKYNSNVVIATTTDNNFIRDIANKYKIDVVVGKHTSIGGDFDFAIKTGNTELITIAHQDDVYDYEYSFNIVESYQKNKNASIIIPNYYELKGDKKVTKNINLIIKRLLLSPLRIRGKAISVFAKRLILRFGNSIGCPSVTFVRNKITFPIFDFPYKCNVDWAAWEKLSRKSGDFVYVNKYLMGHRIHENSTTTEIIKNNIRTKEDYQILCKFWPKLIAKLIAKIYKNSEKNNNN